MENKPRSPRKQLELISTNDHSRNPAAKVKQDALHRCFEPGESVRSGSEDIEKLMLSKGSYYYQEKAISKTDKYKEQLIRIRELFKENESADVL